MFGPAAAMSISSPVLDPAAGFRPDIEGLRAIAVLLVVLYHVGLSFCGGGYIGVDVFFVLSGYLISGLIVREIEMRGRLDLVHFYARRARRLLPASLLMVAVTSGAIALLLSPPEQVNLSSAARATAGYFSNMWFAGEASDYFGPRIETNPFLHTWSLAVEEQFYAVWPLLLFAVLGRGGKRRRLAWVMAGVGAASFAFAVYCTAKHPMWAFYAMPLRGWEFAIGGLAWMIPGKYLGAYWRWLGWLGFLMILGAAGEFSRGTKFPGVAAAVPALGTALVLAGNAAAPASGLVILLRQRILQWLGRRSYSWYLWHWPFLALASALLPAVGIRGRVVMALLSLAVASLSFFLVEDPIRSNRRMAVRKQLSLALAAGLTLVFLSLTQLWHMRATREASLPVYAKLSAASTDGNILQSMDCFANAGDPEVRECSFGDRQSAVIVVLMGDSHAAHWFPAFERLARERSWRLVTLVKSSCPAPAVIHYLTLVGRVEEECATWRAEALRKIVALKPSVVVLASSSNYRKDAYQTVPLTYSEWRSGMERTLSTLDRAHLATVVLLDNPHASVDLPACLSREAMRGGNTETRCIATFNDDIRAAERDAVREFARASVLDLADQFCEGGVCTAMRDGMIVYRDSNHVTASFAAKLAPVVGRRLAF